MKKESNKLVSIILALIELAVGILLLIDPAKFVYTIIVGTGILLIAIAIFCIVKYFFTPALEAAQGQLFLIGAVALIGGIVCIWKTAVIFSKIRWLVLLCGIAILVLGIGKVQQTIDMIRLKSGRWLFQAISAALSLIFGLIIVFNPFASVTAFWTFAGIAFIVAAAADIVAFVASFMKKKPAVKVEADADADADAGDSSER